MTTSFSVRPAMSVVRKEDFADTSDIATAYGRHVTSPHHGPSPTSLSFVAEPVPGGVRLRATSTTPGLAGPTKISHRFYFIDDDEERRRLHQLTPDDPEVTTELLVSLAGKTRDYCHASVFDAQDNLLATQAVVFDTAGRIVTYQFSDRYVSPLPLRDVVVAETHDELGRRVVRTRLELGDLAGPAKVAVAWQSIGSIHRSEFVCSPGDPVVQHDMQLDDNPLLASGQWVVIAVDEEDRLLAQALLTLSPDEPGPPGDDAPGANDRTSTRPELVG